MSRRSKILVFVVVSLVAINVAVFTYFFLDKGKEAQTKIVPDQEANEEKMQQKQKISAKLGNVTGKITKIDGETIEYIGFMVDTVEIPKNERENTSAKLTEETKIQVRCGERFVEIIEEESGEDESVEVVSEGKKVDSGIDPEDYCDGTKKDLNEGDFVLLRVSGKEITWIQKS